MEVQVEKFKRYVYNTYVTLQWVAGLFYVSTLILLQGLLVLLSTFSIGRKFKDKFLELDELTGFLRTFKTFASLETLKKYLH